MAENYYKNNRIYEFESDITSIDIDDKGNFLIELNGTYFYPEGGGQPADKGIIDNIEVIDVQKRNNKVIHTLKNKPQENRVKCLIDKEHRDHYMVQHSGQHLISAVLKHELDIDTLSVHLGENETRIEIDRAEISENEIKIIENKVYELISSGNRIIYHETDDDGLRNYNIRRESKFSGYIRVVEIEGYDSVPCGGVHLSNLYEIGLVKVSGFEKIRGHIRLIFLIGKKAFIEYQKLNNIISTLNSELSTTNETILEGVHTLQKNISQLKVEKKELTTGYIKVLIEQLISSNDMVKVFEDTPISLTQKIATELSGKLKKPILIINKNQRINWYLIDSIEQNIDFDYIRTKLLPIISGKGGGKSGLWQGSGEILNTEIFIREYKSHLDNRNPK